MFSITGHMQRNVGMLPGKRIELETLLREDICE